MLRRNDLAAGFDAASDGLDDEIEPDVELLVVVAGFNLVRDEIGARSRNLAQ